MYDAKKKHSSSTVRRVAGLFVAAAGVATSEVTDEPGQRGANTIDGRTLVLRSI